MKNNRWEAKDLVNTKPEEALKIYKEIWATNPAAFNFWDAAFSLKAMKNSVSSDINWANELAEKYRENEVSNNYGWYIFSKYVKGMTDKQLINNERHISRLLFLAPQKNMVEDDTFPCPTTISVLKLVGAYDKSTSNSMSIYKRINELLSGLDHKLLSTKCNKSKSQQGGELASDKEKYFSLKSKVLFKLGAYEECKGLCSLALETINELHYNNDLWFKMRIALSEGKLGNQKLSENLLLELLSIQAGSDKWFLYEHLSELYFDLQDYEKAWRFAVDAAYYGNDPEYMIKLYYLQTSILFKLERASEGKVIAELIGSILNEQGWKIKEDYNRLFAYYCIVICNLPSVKEIIAQAQGFWTQERYGDKGKNTGIIVSINYDGRKGCIKDQAGKLYRFHRKDLIKRVSSIENLIDSTVEFYPMKSYDGKSVAENIAVLKQKPTTLNYELIGKKVNGPITKILDFGIFVRIHDNQNGLLHKSNLPQHFQDDFEERFNVGDKIIVNVLNVTDKGYSLKYIEE